VRVRRIRRWALTNDWACTRDNVTGLIWEVKTSDNAGDTFTFADASAVHAAAVNTAQLCGFNDWRVPTRRELLSIVHHGAGAVRGNRPDVLSEHCRHDFYWSSDIYAPDSGQRVGRQFQQWQYQRRPPDHGYLVRLVRSDQPTPPSNFSDNSNGTVTDLTTGLMWDRCSWGQTWDDVTNECDDDATPHDWEAALGIAVTANAANHRGYSDWRLPNRTELESLVDLSTSNPAIDTDRIPQYAERSFWSSTVYTPNPAGAWNVGFNNGDYRRQPDQRQPRAPRA
jgi:hypothetical protein